MDCSTMYNSIHRGILVVCAYIQTKMNFHTKTQFSKMTTSPFFVKSIASLPQLQKPTTRRHPHFETVSVLSMTA